MVSNINAPTGNQHCQPASWAPSALAQQNGHVRLMLATGRSDERGFTAASSCSWPWSIGMIVLLGAFMLLDRSFSASGQVADRADALQRGRQAMELMTRQLRSQVCLGKTTRRWSARTTTA